MDASTASLAGGGGGLATVIFDPVLYDRLPLTITIVTIALIVLVTAKLSCPTLDPEEPPLLRSRVPVIGHIIGLIRHQASYHIHLSKKYSKVKCATLPMPNGKLYAVYDPYLCQQVLRNNTASFDPFQQEFAQKVFGLSQATYDKICLQPSIFKDFTEAIHRSFQTESLARMNLLWLTDFTAKINPMSAYNATVDPDNTGRERIAEDGAVEVENLFLWYRDFMTLATSRALYGDHDPFIQNRSMIEACWIYEEAIPYFLVSLFPSITIPRAHKARQHLQQTMGKYYTAGYRELDPATATLTVNRAKVLADYGFTGNEIGLMECILPVVSTLNAVPTLYWLLLHILADPSLVEKIREEIAASVGIPSSDSSDGRVITFEISKFDTELPLLVSCYKETLRLVNHVVCNRRVMQDMIIKDQDGHTYLLKKGVDIQLPGGVTHRETATWGSDAEQFKADRFLTSTTKITDADRARKAAYMPFGGGKHLCPGRNFAFAEIIGCAAVMLLGFDIEAIGMDFEEMGMQGPRLSSATVKPINDGKGLGGRIKPRDGFGNVSWKFQA